MLLVPALNETLPLVAFIDAVEIRVPAATVRAPFVLFKLPVLTLLSEPAVSARLVP